MLTSVLQFYALFFPFLLASAQATDLPKAPSRTWSKVQYLGGAPDIPDRKKGWDSKLTITEDKLLCSLKSGPSFEISLDLIEAINYGSLRVTRAAFAAVSVVAWPSALLGRYPKAKSHLVGIEFRREGAPNAGILLRVDKDDIEPFLETLRLRLASHSKNTLNKKEKERAPS